MLTNQNLFGIPIINSVLRDHRGRFASVPGYQSNLKLIRIHFESGLSLTVVECINLYHITELRAYVSKLRKLGMNIVGKRFTGYGKTYNVYRLVKLQN